MLDIFNLPLPSSGGESQIFNIPSTVTNLQFHTWVQPRGKTMMHILCIGGGGGGGGGFTGIAASARAGGGGGGGSAVSSLVIPLIYVPDTLYVQVGAGGQGAVSGGGTAGSGILSFVCVHPVNTTVLNVLAVSGAVAATGGGTGTVTTAGAAGVAGTVAAIASMPLATLGVYNFIVGGVGFIGGTITGAGANATFATTGVLCSGGTGGGGVTGTAQVGGGYTAVTDSILSLLAPVQAPISGIAGSGGFNGVSARNPFFSYGGLGGSSSNATAGGEGGTGGPGSGGGGGGGGTTGGRGGDGDSGLVVITCW